MESWDLPIGKLEFEDETHTYYFNGKKCISVTQLIHVLMPDKYKGIEEHILRTAASRGSEIHNAIEVYEKFGFTREDLQEFRNYLFLKKYYKFKVTHSEIPIVIIYKDLIVAGRLDQIVSEPIDDGERLCVNDIKTTATLDKQYLSIQDTLYKYGVMQTYGLVIDGLRATHLRKDVRKYVVIDELNAENILDKYLEIKEKENAEEASA